MVHVLLHCMSCWTACFDCINCSGMCACLPALCCCRWIVWCMHVSCIDSEVHSCFELWSALSQCSWIRRYISVTYYYYIVWHEITKITLSVYSFHMILKDMAESTSSQKCAVTVKYVQGIVMLLCTCTGDDWWLRLWGADSNINRSDLPDAIWPVGQG